MKTMLAVLFLILFASVMAQDKKSSVRITSESPELGKLLRDELAGSSVVVTATKRGDLEVTAALSPLGEDTGCRGVIGVLLIESRAGRQLSAFIASDVSALARQMAQRLSKGKQWR